jgi:hypothetical protein
MLPVAPVTRMRPLPGAEEVDGFEAKCRWLLMF